MVSGSWFGGSWFGWSWPSFATLAVLAALAALASRFELRAPASKTSFQIPNFLKSGYQLMLQAPKLIFEFSMKAYIQIYTQILSDTPIYIPYM